MNTQVPSIISSLTQRYAQDIAGTLACYDRLIINGTLTAIAYDQAMEAHLQRLGIPTSEFCDYARNFTEQLHAHARATAAEHGVQVEFLRSSKGIRKETHIAEIIAKRGSHPGLVHILEVMETCETYKIAGSRNGPKYLKPSHVLCAVYYYYLIDKDLGLMYVRVPTYLPCRLQIYCNGHNWLANELRKEGIGYQMYDNCFTQIDNWERAQEIAASLSLESLHQILDRLSQKCCPIKEAFGGPGYHWSVSQVECALDITFKDRQILPPLYEEISRQAMLSVKIDDMMRFWNKTLHKESEGQSDFHTYEEGRCIKHRIKRQSIKMYDKGGQVLRIEVTSNDITYYQHHRKVVQRDGTTTYKLAHLKKSIYSLGDLFGLMSAACRRYLAHISTLVDKTPMRREVDKIAEPVRDTRSRSWRGFNIFRKEDREIMLSILRGEHTIKGLSNKTMRAQHSQYSSSSMGRILRRLREHHLIKRAAKSYHYYITALGERFISSTMRMIEEILLPGMDTKAAAA